MITFTLKELAQLARLETSSEQAIATVSTNSQEIGPQCLFVPLKGERFDGHDFIAGALAQGAVAYASSRPDTAETSAVKVACPHTLRLLGAASWCAVRARPWCAPLLARVVRLRSRR